MFIGATNLAASGTVALTVRLNREPSMDTIHAFSCFIFSFCNQIQLPYVVEKMQNSERDLMPTLMWSSVLLFVFNCLFSLAGWLAVDGGAVNGDILRNLPVGTVVRACVRACCYTHLVTPFVYLFYLSIYLPTVSFWVGANYRVYVVGFNQCIRWAIWREVCKWCVKCRRFLC